MYERKICYWNKITGVPSNCIQYQIFCCIVRDSCWKLLSCDKSSYFFVLLSYLQISDDKSLKQNNTNLHGWMTEITLFGLHATLTQWTLVHMNHHFVTQSQHCFRFLINAIKFTQCFIISCFVNPDRKITCFAPQVLQHKWNKLDQNQSQTQIPR